MRFYLLGILTVLVAVPVLGLAGFGVYALVQHPKELERVRSAQAAICDDQLRAAGLETNEERKRHSLEEAAAKLGKR